MEDRESKVQSLDEYLGERGLSFPVSDFMLDKTRIPHGLTSRAEKRMHREGQSFGSGGKAHVEKKRN